MEGRQREILSQLLFWIGFHVSILDFDGDLIECLVTIQSLFEFAVFFFLSANVNLLVLFEMSVGGFKPSTLPPLSFNVLLCLSFNYVLLKKLFFILGPPFCWLVKDVFSTWWMLLYDWGLHVYWLLLARGVNGKLAFLVNYEQKLMLANVNVNPWYCEAVVVLVPLQLEHFSDGQFFHFNR